MKLNATYTIAAILVASCFSLSAGPQETPKSPPPKSAPAPKGGQVKPAVSTPTHPESQGQGQKAAPTNNSRPAPNNSTPQTSHTPANNSTPQATHTPATTPVNGRGPAPNTTRPNGPGEQKGPGFNANNDRPSANNNRPGGGPGPAIPRGAHSVPFNGGSKVVRADGSLHSVQARGITVTHGPNGMRNVVADRPDGSRVVVNRGGGGYVQRPFSYHGTSYVSRTYVVNHVTSVSYYRQYSYPGRPGLTLAIYSPRAYYSPGFYGWAYHPWGPSISFAWGWGGAPWYAYYGPYYSPYPVYPSAVPWLTDYLISASLQDAYAQQDQGGPPPSGPPISPQVKDYIGQEVQRQLMLANAEGQTQQRGADIDPGSSSVARILSDGQPHVFVAHAGLDLVDASGSECVISEGDALQFTPPAAAGAGAVNVQVLWSRGQDCRIGSTVSLGLDNLQEMQNYMRSTVDTALADLKSKQGHDGIPSAPAVANTNPVPAQYAPLAPPPDPNANAALKDELGAADQVEKDANGH